MKVNAVFFRLLVVIILTAAGGVFVTAQSVADVDAVVQKAIASRAMPGAGVAVVRGGKVLIAKGYGLADVDAATPVTESTAFQIASVTKQLTAAGVMLLVEKGKVKLDDPVVKYVPEVPAKWSGVTVRQLLNQVSGIPNYNAGGRFDPNKVYTKPEVLDGMREVPLSSEPGVRWEYSNTNFFLLGLVIEKVSGKPYADFMRDQVFKPLGMDSTLVNAKGLAIKNAARGYSLQGKWVITEISDPGFPYAAGAIVSTPADMAKWAIAVGEGKLLKKTSWDETLASGKTADGKSTNYGFGWNLGTLGESYIAHSGGIQGFGTYHVRFPAHDLSVVVMTNTIRVATDLANDIAGVYLPKVAEAVAAEVKKAEAARNAAAIEDADPETTKFLKSVFEGMARGEGDRSLFAEDFAKVMFPDRIKTLKGPLGNEGAVKTLELLAAENKDGIKVRRYRAIFESGMRVRVTFTLDAQGKIAGTVVGRE